MNREDLQIRAGEARQVLENDAFRAAVGAAFAYSEQQIEQAETPAQAWDALQGRKGLRHVMGYLHAALWHGDNLQKAALQRVDLEAQGLELEQEFQQWYEKAQKERAAWAGGRPPGSDAELTPP